MTDIYKAIACESDPNVLLYHTTHQEPLTHMYKAIACESEPNVLLYHTTHQEPVTHMYKVESWRQLVASELCQVRQRTAIGEIWTPYDRSTDRSSTDTPTDRPTDRLTDRPTDRQTYRPTRSEGASCRERVCQYV